MVTYVDEAREPALLTVVEGVDAHLPPEHGAALGTSGTTEDVVHRAKAGAHVYQGRRHGVPAAGPGRDDSTLGHAGGRPVSTRRWDLRRSLNPGEPLRAIGQSTVLE